MANRAYLGIFSIGLILSASATLAATPETRWPTFRGSLVGVASDSVAEDWDGASGKNILWKTPIPLPGQNAPIVWNDSIFLSGANDREQVVFCIDANTGKLRWQKQVGAPDPAHAPKVMDDTGLAPSTMVCNDKRVFAIFPTGDFVALDFEGNIAWQKKLGPLDSQYGYASSLAIWKDMVIVQLDQGLEARDGKSAILAFNEATGDQAWRTPRPVAGSWSSPIVAETPTGAQVITSADPWVIAYDPQNGVERWRSKALEGDIAPSPAYANGIAYFAQENCDIRAVKVDGAGDVTESKTLWHVDEPSPDIVSPLATEKFVLVVATSGTVTCLNAQTGAKVWHNEFDGPFCASPIMAGNVVLLTQRDGVTYRFALDDTFKLLNSPALGEAVYATPAIAHGKIYIRSRANLYCIGSK